MRKCIICQKELTEPIYHMPNMPAAVQHMPLKEDLQQDKGMDLVLYQCGLCGLVQFDCDAVYYYKDVIRAGGFSEELKGLRRKQYREFIHKYRLDGKKIWEVGCGKGEFLEILKEFPVQGFGIEHDMKLVEAANSKGLNVCKAFADKQYMDSRGPFDAFLSFNYLEHQPKPVEMVRCIYDNLLPGGVGLLTVPSFEYFIEKAAYYEFMRDHIAYYTESSLVYLFETNGFEVLEKSRFNGDTTQMIVRKRQPLILPDFDHQRKVIENEINSYIEEHAGEIKKAAVWGASHQGLTILATITINADIRYIVDSADFKWGHYSPVSHLPIVPPVTLFRDDMDLVIILAPAFSDEIAETIWEKCPNIRHILAVKDDKVLDKSRG